MNVLHDLRILHIPRERILVAAVTIADGHKIEVVRVTGEDFKVDVAEARRLAGVLLGILRNDFEIEVDAVDQVAWMAEVECSRTWRTT